MRKETKDLQTMTEKWMQMGRKTIEERKIADKYYEEKLMELITEDFIERNKGDVFEEVKYLIMSLGTSYEPLVLNIQLLKPERILFLCTEETEKYLDKITKHCKLQASMFQKTIVGETNPEDVYQEIKSAYLQWGKPDKMYIDFTGGTKAMSAAAAMAGAMIDVQLIYVGSNEYLVDFRKPKPGSETLFYIDNPLSVFGDLEIEKAFILFKQHNYSGAREKLESLKESVPDPVIRQQLKFVYLLACMYELWDSLEFVGAFKCSNQLSKELERDRKRNKQFLLMDLADNIKAQRNMLEPLSEIPQMIKEKRNMEILMDSKFIIPLMFTMCQNAMIREIQEKYDMATLLLYRLLEMIEQRRLARYNLYVSQMNYLTIKADTKVHPEWAKLSGGELFDIIKERYFAIRQKVFGKSGGSYIPDQISLLEGFILLLALDDDISKQENGNHIDKLKRIRAMVYLRNNSIFAHGLGPVASEDFDKFKKFVLEMFVGFCKLEGIDFIEYQRKIKWVTPFESRNYTGIEGK